MSEQKKILKFIKRVRRRLCINVLFKTFMLAPAAEPWRACCWMLHPCLFRIYYVDYYVIGCVGVGIITGLIIGIFRMPGEAKGCTGCGQQRPDERFVTSLESFEKEDGFYNLQRLDTVKHIERFDLKGNIRLTFLAGGSRFWRHSL